MRIILMKWRWGIDISMSFLSGVFFPIVQESEKRRKLPFPKTGG